jgi:sec-independent protein translocase protein TatC
MSARRKRQQPQRRQLKRRHLKRQHLRASHELMSTQETFISHLVELRDRLIRSISAVLVVFLCLVWFAKDLYALLALPMIHALPHGGQMIATDVVGVFLVPMKVTLVISFVIALPYVLYQAWAFVAPGLYVHEKKLVLPLIVASSVLFIIGMAFAYFIVFPAVFTFMAAVAPEGVAWMTDIEKYLSFVLTMFIAFGVTFETPIVVIVLVRTGVVTTDKLREWRPYIVVGAFVAGAIFAPPDVTSQFALAIPMWLLFELGLWLAGFIGKSPASSDYQPQTDAQMEAELDRSESTPNKD